MNSSIHWLFKRVQAYQIPMFLVEFKEVKGILNKYGTILGLDGGISLKHWFESYHMPVAFGGLSSPV